jgi:CheY-like chemotaxis protein
MRFTASSWSGLISIAAVLICAWFGGVEKPGNQVRVAYDGQEAVEVASVFQPDIVFMDLAMPKLDGYGAARHIRKQPWGQQMVLVAVSGWGQDGHKKLAQEAGFDHHLVKPADAAQLKRLLAGAKRRETATSSGG